MLMDEFKAGNLVMWDETVDIHTPGDGQDGRDA